MTTKKTKKAQNKKGKFEWCSRVLVTSPVYFGLCTSELSFRRGLKELGVDTPPQWLLPEDCGRVHQFERASGGIALVVCIYPVKNAKEAMTTLAHEAVHVWQAVREYLGEQSPSAEFEAYSIENIFTTLMTSYFKTTKKKRTNGNSLKRKQHQSAQTP